MIENKHWFILVVIKSSPREVIPKLEHYVKVCSMSQVMLSSLKQFKPDSTLWGKYSTTIQPGLSFTNSCWLYSSQVHVRFRTVSSSVVSTPCQWAVGQGTTGTATHDHLRPQCLSTVRVF